jgi:OmpR family response regulator RpaB
VTILLADGDPTSRLILKTQLSNYGYHIITTSDGEEALSTFNKGQFHVVLIDIMIPKIDGYKVCSKLRNISSVPIILLAALNSVTDRIIGLSLGADDFLIKPFSVDELNLKLCSLLRRSYNHYKYPLVIQIGGLKLNLFKKHVYKNDQIIRLTTIEFNLLEILVAKAGKTLTRIDIFDKVWGHTTFRYSDIRVVDVYICRLRSKIEQNPNTPDLILTVRSKGYMFQKI